MLGSILHIRRLIGEKAMSDKNRIVPTDERFLDFYFTGLNGSLCSVQFSEFEKKFRLLINNEIILRATSITLVYKDRMIVFMDHAKEIGRIKIAKIDVLGDWDWARNIREPGKSPGVITIDAENAIKAKSIPY